MIGALRTVWRGAGRYALPAVVVVAVGALPGTTFGDAGAGDSTSDNSEHERASALVWDDQPTHTRPQEDTESTDAGLPVVPVLAPPTTQPPPPVVDALGASGIPAVALRAYRAAEATLALTDPSCGLRWSLVAAIGRVESNHGRYGGAQLREDGTGTKPIRGIPLDGRPGVATIRDTDGGALDDDTVYDRAVGPMQFIPSSWRFAAADGNGDGLKDPHNIFDAALAAGGYLCAGDTNLRDPAQRSRAVFRYNRSEAYVSVVLSLADEYERGVTELPTVPPSPEGPPVLPSPELPPASVTPDFAWNSVPANNPGTTTTTRPGTTTSSTTTSTTPSSTTTTTVCPPTTTTTEPSTTTTTDPSTTTTTTVADPSCPTTTTTTPPSTTNPSTTTTTGTTAPTTSTTTTP